MSLPGTYLIGYLIERMVIQQNLHLKCIEKINAVGAFPFLIKNNTAAEHWTKEYVIHHRPEIQEFSKGKKITDESSIKCMRGFKHI